MMAKMRELNGKNPALLARIWEEERRTKATEAPKSPVVPNKPSPQVTAAPAVQASIPQVANQRKKAVPREPAKSATVAPVPIPAAVVRPQAPAVPARAGGHTIWPPERKTQLAAAAATYLNAQNPSSQVDPARVLIMLGSNPSYIELCEQLETMGLKLDRAAFAKNLLSAVPDVNSSTRKSAPQSAPIPVQRPHVPPAIMKNDVATPATMQPTFVAASPATRSSFTPFPSNASPPAHNHSVPVAEMVPIRPELKLPANKEEAARKRNLSDLVDLTQLDDDDDMGPPPKKRTANSMYPYGSPHADVEDAMMVNSEPAINNFPIANAPSQPVQGPVSQPAPVPNSDIRYKAVVEPLDRNKALRRNTYNSATIARDVLLACGRHPSERQLNQHLDVLRSNLTFINFDSDLSTIKWSLLDPGNPPPGYFKDSMQGLNEDADDEEDSDDEREARPRSQSNATSGSGGSQARVQALPEAINPFKQQKRRGRPRQSLPSDLSQTTPKRPANTANMSVSAPRPATAGVGYQAFRSATEYGPDGQPLPRKMGRPTGWRKAIHGSAATNAQKAVNGFTKHQPTHPSSLRNVNTGDNEPIRIDSRSPSVVNHVPRYQSYKCQWQNCSAELHNLETLKKHVFKVHRKATLRNTLECLWSDCGREVTSHDPNTNLTMEKHTPHSFDLDLENDWRNHIQETHFDPLSWELGDGPASGLSGKEARACAEKNLGLTRNVDAHDSEAYLSDAQGRRVTPRIELERVGKDAPVSAFAGSAPRGRGRPPKNTLEKEARETQERLIAQKKRIGGPGMDRGGATLVNDKRRKGFNHGDDLEEELVAVED
jgi:hypothetical protein